MKNYITTIAGFLAANALFITPIVDAFNSGAFTGKTALQIVGYVAIIWWGIFTKDKNTTGIGENATKDVNSILGTIRPDDRK